MKSFYSIGEISKLYNVSVDILRHYDKIDLLKPVLKKENGYRYYSREQIWILNNIRSLRKLGLSLEKIKIFLKERNLETTKNIIDFQLNSVNKEIESLLKLKSELLSKKEKLKYFQDEIIFNKPILKYIPKRNIIKLKGKIKNEEDIDYAIKRLTAKTFFENNFIFADSERGVTLNKKDFLNGNYNIYSETFIVDNEKKFSNDILKEGLFLTLFFKGNYSESYKYYNLLKKFIKLEDLEVVGDIYEFFHIDIHATSTSEEYISEVQIPVIKIEKDLLK